MKAMQVRLPAAIDTLTLVDLPPLGEPGPGEIKVRLRATSLNYHDFAIVSGAMRTAENRIPMSDGAGEVLSIGGGVTEFAVGQSVVSTFFTRWLDGDGRDAGFRTVPGDGIDGYAREEVIVPAHWFTRCPPDTAMRRRRR